MPTDLARFVLGSKTHANLETESCRKRRPQLSQLSERRLGIVYAGEQRACQPRGKNYLRKLVTLRLKGAKVSPSSMKATL